ncbi:MAG: hypothetical protein U0457_08880 [Candidatus Sericytochromatia bacterium]
MNSFIFKYVIIFCLTVISTDTFLFFYSTVSKEKENQEIKILSKAIEKSLEKEDLTTVNDILDSYEDKVILQRDGVIYTSNYGEESEERRVFATEQLQTYRPFWRSLEIPSEKYNQLIYYKTKEISFFNKIINNTLISLAVALMTLPILFLSLLQIRKQNKEEEKLKYYLKTIRENMEEVKDKEIIQKYEEDRYDKLRTKLEESKNKRLELKKEIENKNAEIEKLKAENNKIKLEAKNLKTEIQTTKDEKTKLEESNKNALSKEKTNLSLKITSLEEQLANKEETIKQNKLKIFELEEKLNKEKETIMSKNKELSSLKISKVATEEFKEREIQVNTLERALGDKNIEIRDLLKQLELKNERINSLKEDLNLINMEKLRLDNEVNTLKVKKDSDKDVIEALITENNLYKDKVINLNDKLREYDNFSNLNPNNFSATDEDERFKAMLKARDEIIRNITNDKNKIENELKELTLDTIDKLSAVKRFEIQVADMTKEILKKNNLIDSLNSRIDAKDKLINTLVQEINELKEKIQTGDFAIINEIIKD